MLSALVLLFLMLYTPLAFLVIGEWVLEGAGRRIGEPADRGGRFFLAYLMCGLLLFLCGVLAAAALGMPLQFAAILALSPSALRLRRIAPLLRRAPAIPSFNLALWITVIVTLGASLIAVVEGIQTPWRNNYGDLAWHLGMTASFTFGANFPPENHIFPPAVLSYPFFVNLWTAALWIFLPSLGGLAWLYLYQWTFLWLVIYWALDGDRRPLLPWAVLFGGGAYLIVFRAFNMPQAAHVAVFGPYAHDLIGHGYPWVPFLDSVWVTQRPALLGAAVLLVSVQLVHRSLYGEPPHRAHAGRAALFAGLLLGLSPLAQTHFFLVGAVYMSLLYLVGLCRREEWPVNGRHLLLFAAGCLPAICFAPWVIGKSGIIQFAGAWMQRETLMRSGIAAAAAAGARLWADNALPWLALSAFAFAAGRRYAAGAVLLLLFLLGNVLQIAIWEWDEIKIFLAIYLISISLWQVLETAAVKTLHWWLLVLMLPAAAELWIVLGRYERFGIYSDRDIAEAKEIQEEVPPAAIIAAAPEHNSVATLTGRKMYYGYEGTLHSHGIDYAKRQQLQLSLELLKACRPSETEPCPEYLLWGPREKSYWKRQLPGEGFEATKVKTLYRIVR